MTELLLELLREARGRAKRAFWEAVAAKVDRFIKPRYGVTVSNNVLTSTDGYPVLSIKDDEVTIRGAVKVNGPVDLGPNATVRGER